MIAGGAGADRPAARPPAFVPFAAKLSPPAAAIPLVERPRLVDGLLGFGGRAVVMSAPAGYGKSILAAQWLAAETRATAWLSLDRADRDPHVLLTYLGLALGDARGHGLHADAELGDLLVRLELLLAARSEPFVLVLDDAHLLQGPSTEIVRILAEHVPPGSTLAVLTRDPPLFPTARGVVHGSVLVLDRAALAMTPDEADGLLRRGGVAEPGAAVEVLTEVTEGWAAGLYLATLALREADDPVAAAETISGRHRRIADFFAEEVLPTIAAEDVDFLLATAVLDHFSADLCDEVLDRHDSGEVLERLARSNRFVLPLDETGDWYRHHHLFAEMLLAEAQRRDAAAVARAASRASVWWEARFEPDAAVMLAFAANDRERALDLISRWGPVLQTDRRRATVEQWLGAFSDDEVCATPALALTAAWSALVRGDAAGVHRFASAVDAAADDTALPNGTSCAAAAELLRALTTSRGLHAMRDHAAHARREHPAGSVYVAVAALFEANARLLLGDLAGSEPVIDLTLTLGLPHWDSALVQGLGTRARREAIAGDWAAALESVDQAVTVAEASWLHERPPIGLVYATAALVFGHTGRPTRARAARACALGLVPRLEDVMPFLSTLAMIELTESALATDDVDEACRHLADAERRLRRLRDTGLLPFAFGRVGEAITAATARPASTLVEPLSPAELRVLAYLPTHLSFGEVGEELFVSRNTVKSHAVAIYRKLGVTSRSAAVKAARDLGLLP